MRCRELRVFKHLVRRCGFQPHLPETHVATWRSLLQKTQFLTERSIHQVNSDATVEEWDDGRSISVIRMMDHPVGNPVDTPAPMYARLKNAPIRLGNPMPKLGSDTREVLLEIGYSDEQINEWISEGVVKEQLHDKYLPS